MVHEVLWLKGWTVESGFYVYFRTDTFGKGMNLIVLPAMG